MRIPVGKIADQRKSAGKSLLEFYGGFFHSDGFKTHRYTVITARFNYLINTVIPDTLFYLMPISLRAISQWKSAIIC
jgi:hypothetical protein